MTRLVGIYREKEYSPGRHQSNDTLLIEQVARLLRERSLRVDLATIDDAAGRLRGAGLVFSMCQGRIALDRLAAWEREGAQIVNSPRAALNTYRDRLPGLMVKAGVPYPETQLVATSDRGPEIAARHRLVERRFQNGERRGFWLKRGDVHASVASDVQWIDSPAALEDGLAEFRSRNIATAAVQAHRDGDEIKFYGVAGTGFFHWFYSGASEGYAFDLPALPRLASRAAAAAGLDVYGGDLIVSAAGELTLIDLNDWPSFAPCRSAAAGAIADDLTRRVHAAWNRGLVPSANQSAV